MPIKSKKNRKKCRQKNEYLPNVGMRSSIAHAVRRSGSFHILSSAAQPETKATLAGRFDALFPVEIGYLTWFALARTCGC
jgi:hypothetical protein